ncbi:MAG: hypothetical protein ACPGVU_02425 [Limisphaerales bacterium]
MGTNRLLNLGGRIRKRPNGDWLVGRGATAISSNDTLAISSGGNICVYSRTAKPLGMFKLPGGEIPVGLSFANDQTLFTHTKRKGYFLTLSGKLLGGVKTPLRELVDGRAVPFAAVKGTELWYVTTKPLKLIRYRIPSSIVAKMPAN